MFCLAIIKKYTNYFKGIVTQEVVQNFVWELSKNIHLQVQTNICLSRNLSFTF